jgi:FKBP-type peptidyl-prolyl cis-trans isomerase
MRAKMLVFCALALLLSACGRVESIATPIPTFSPQPTIENAATTPTTAAAPAGQAPAGPTKVDPATLVKTASGLQYAELKVGDGAEAVAGKNVSVHYTGWLEDGTKFDSSLDRGQPFTLMLGTGQVIKGWDEGLVGMKVGGSRQLIIPSDLGYGPQGTGPIPGGATLIFEVQLLDVK